MLKNQKSALVIFKENLSEKDRRRLRDIPQCDAVIAPNKLRQEIRALGREWVALEGMVEVGSIYEASVFAEELSRLTLPNGSRLSKSFIYKGYELWWMHYNSLFLYFCLPYTQYRKLLDYLKSFQSVSFYRPPYSSLFYCYLHAHGCEISKLREPGLKSSSFLPFGILLQIFITLLSLPVLMVRKRHLMVFTGDKFEKFQDYDFRMKFIYRELRQKNLPFVEFIRSLESWKTVLKHALVRKRPVIYSEGVAFVGRFMSVASGGHRRARRRFGPHIFDSKTDKEARFKLLVATQYLLGVYDDIWAIRIMKWILRALGVKVALITTATERNFHTVLGCKLNTIPIIGIMHGVASRSYNVYDFLPAFDGAKMLSVDKYGLWSEWWKGYYVKNSKAYRKEQLYVSGPMRPPTPDIPPIHKDQRPDSSVRVLFVSEQLAVPEEVFPYLELLLKEEDISVYLTFRSYRDGFEVWLKENHPETLETVGKSNILRDGINSAVDKCDVVVGTHSTAVLESLFNLKPFVFFHTKKWGDYFNLKGYSNAFKFYTESTEELIESIGESKKVSKETLKKLQNRFFGDPYKNGSKWVVEQAERVLRQAL